MNRLLTYVFIATTLSLYSCNEKVTANSDAVILEKTDNSTQANEVANNNNSETTIEFEEKDFDFKEVIHGEKVTHEFFFTNTGEKPLIINNIEVSCGCTTPQYTKEPVTPGNKGSVTVTFNSSGFSGLTKKTFTVSGNFPTQVVNFKANVK